MRVLLLSVLSVLHSLITLGGTQRSVTLSQWLAKGVRKSEYRTIANNVLDGNGNVVQQKFGSMKDANGQTVYYCIDATGQRRSDGEEYGRPNGHFKYRCSNGIETIIACIGSDRIGKKVLKVGETFRKDGLWHKCIHYANNQTAIYAEENSCSMNNKLYRIGEEMRSEYFLMQCAENGYKILGCFYRDNSNKTVDVKLGTVTEADGVEHHCEDSKNSIKYYSKIMGCIKNGIRYKEGEQFAKNHLRYECKNGMVTITGCYMEKEQEKLEIGNSAVNSNMLYKCYFENGGVMFEQYPCGLRGTPTCEIPKGELTRMPPAMLAPKPGYKAFGMVQYIQQGNDKIMPIGGK